MVVYDHTISRATSPPNHPSPPRVCRPCVSPLASRSGNAACGLAVASNWFAVAVLMSFDCLGTFRRRTIIVPLTASVSVSALVNITAGESKTSRRGR